MTTRDGDPDVTLDYERFPRGEVEDLRLVVSHREIGLAFKLHCFEVGPFHEGTAEKRRDGSVVFRYASGSVACETTFRPLEGGRVVMDIEVRGPAEELRATRFIDACMQHWESPAFRRRGPLTEFAERAFVYTMRGPVGLLDTARGPQQSVARDSLWNNPPCTQWYVDCTMQHPGDIWSFGTCGDRPVAGLIGVVSQDGRWLTAMGRPYARTLGQGWHDCLHCGSDMRSHLDESTGALRQRTYLYVVPNDKEALYRMYVEDSGRDPGPSGGVVRDDIPGDVRRGRQLPPLAVEAQDEALVIRAPEASVPPLKLVLTGNGLEHERGPWQRTYWGTWSWTGKGWKAWAHPVGNALDLCVSVLESTYEPPVGACLLGEGWADAASPEGVPAWVLRTQAGAWHAALFWERPAASDPSQGLAEKQEPGATTKSVRGRVVVWRGGLEELTAQWQWAETDWKHAVPYRMPVPEGLPAPVGESVTFAPGRQPGDERLTYGLTVVPHWKDAGYVHVNLPEHLEYDDEDPANDYVGYSILRHWDERDYPWRISADGRTATLEVESPHEPGVLVQARLTAHHHMAILWMKVANHSAKDLPRVKALLCFQYARLAGFPGSRDDNLRYTSVMVGGRLVRIPELTTARFDPDAVVAYARGCGQHDCDKFANERGGLIAEELDTALVAVSSKNGKRTLLLGSAPPKSVLSNTHIPCAHADPLFGDVKRGESAEVTEVVVFVEGDPTEAAREVARREWLRGTGM